MIRQVLLLSVLTLASAGSQAQSATYAVDPTHTNIGFEIGHLGVSTNRGRLMVKEGTVQLDRAGKAGKVDLTIDTTNIITGIPAFSGHLGGKDFFNAAEFPTAKFVADKFSFNGDKVSEVSGQLTLLGKTNPVTLKSTAFNCVEDRQLKRERCGGDFETTIVRSQWGMGWGLNFGFPDNVRLVLQVEAIKQ